jgi:hypothetical protein
VKVATGGVPAAATGGVPATGGVSGTAGAPAAGGTPVTSTSTGGATAQGSGGRPAPGAGGAGGDATAGGDAACAQYVADYDAALAKARECTGKGDECGKSVPAALSGCKASCKTYVEDDTALKDIRRQWDKAGCVSAACSAVVCISGTSSCDTSGSDGKDDRAAKKGMCSDSLIVL